MTGEMKNAELKDTMAERARSAAEAGIDLGPVIKAGNRRRRVRAIGASGLAVVAVAAMAFGGNQLLGADDTAQPQGPAVTGERQAPTYASGSTIHLDDESIDLGDHTLYSYVRTDDGFVFTDENGTVYFTDGSAVEKIGSGTEDGRLRSDDSGSYVAWVDRGPEVPEFVVYDTASMSEVVRTSEGVTRNRANVAAVDGEGVYVFNGDGFARIDIGTGDSELLRDDIAKVSAIPDVEDGWILRQVRDGRGNHDGDVPPGTVLSRDPAADAPLTVTKARELSPDAKHVSSEYDDSERIFEAHSMEEVKLDTSAYWFQAAVEWLDDDTLVLMALNKPQSEEYVGSLLTCEIPSGQCTAAMDDLDLSDIVLPVGEPTALD